MSNYSDLAGIGVTSGIKRILTGNVSATTNILIAGEPVNPSKSIVVMTKYSLSDTANTGNAASFEFSISADGASIQFVADLNTFQNLSVGYALLEFT